MERLLDRLRQAERVTVLSHVNPDGDAVGTVLGLAQALESLGGKRVDAVLQDGVPPVFSFLAGSAEIRQEIPDPEESAERLFLIVDAPDTARTGFAEHLERPGVSLALLDHHPKGNLAKLASAAYHRLDAAAAAELAYEVCLGLGAKITPAIATSLLTGLYTDTGGFQQPNTTPRTLEIASDLMRRGGKLQRIVHEIARSKSVTTLRLLGIALENVSLTLGGTCAVTALTEEDIRSVGAEPDDIPGIIGSVNVLDTVRFSLVLIQETADRIRGRLRSGEGEGADVGKLAALLGGGGHQRAAGFELPGRLQKIPGGWRILPPAH